MDFAAFEKRIDFYPTSSRIEVFRCDFAGLKWAKGPVQFPLDLQIPCALIKKRVEFRGKETRTKPATQAGKRRS